MSAQPLDPEAVAEGDSGDYILLGVFLLGVLTTALLGVLGWCCRCGSSPKE